MKRILLICALLLSAGMPNASADDRTVSDADDAPGVFDLAAASHGHGNATEQIVHRFETFEAWTNDQFLGAHIKIWLPDGDSGQDRILTITTNPDDSLTAGMTSLDSPSTPFRGYANVYRTGETSFEVVMPARLIARSLEVYRWKAFLFYSECPEGQEDDSCSGYDTHEGRVRHRIP